MPRNGDDDDDDSRPAFGAGPSVLAEHPLPLRFVGSGSAYFGIWISNLLLTLLTLGLYYPYARLRRLRYFYGATTLGGHPLSFHARVRGMYAVYALGAVLAAAPVGAWLLADGVSLQAGAAACAGVALLWPALWHAALRSRLGNTRWRGLRFGFGGARGGACLALWPLFVCTALLVAGKVLASPAPLLALALLPALFWLLRRYQHDHYQLASEHTRFAVPLRAFYGLSLRALGVALLAALLTATLLGVLLSGSIDAMAAELQDEPPTWTVQGVLIIAVGLWLLQVMLRPYVVARLQNLVWNGTRSHNLRFDSSLRYAALLGLTLQNWLFIIVTLGLYLPFAAVATARLRLQAVTVVSTLDAGTFVALAGSLDDTAAADAAGELFGVDSGTWRSP